MAKTLSRIKKINIDVIKDDKVEQKIVTVSKAPLGSWKKLSDSIQKLLNLLPEVLAEKGIEEKKELENYFDNMSQQDVLMLLPDMLEVAFDEVMRVLSIGTDKDKKFMEKFVGIDEAVDIFEAIVEVNNLVKVVEKGKNLMNLLNGIGFGRNRKKLAKKSNSTS